MNFKITHGQINTNTPTHTTVQRNKEAKNNMRTHSRAEHGNKYFQNRNGEKKMNLKNI